MTAPQNGMPFIIFVASSNCCVKVTKVGYAHQHISPITAVIISFQTIWSF